NPAALIFNNVPGPTATTQTITLTNTSSATLQIASPTNSTPNFASITTCATLAPAPTSTIIPSYTPTHALVTRTLHPPLTRSLFAQATPTDGSATLNGLGYVEGYAIATGTLAITGNIIPTSSGPGNPLDFGRVASGQSSTQTLTLTNHGAAPLTIRRITSEWPFLVTATTCGAPLTATQSCTITLAYT